jgi:hypothetical protein
MWNVLSLITSDRTDDARLPMVAPTDDSATSALCGMMWSSCGLRNNVPAAIDEKKSVDPPPGVPGTSSSSNKLVRAVASVASLGLSDATLASEGVSSAFGVVTVSASPLSSAGASVPSTWVEGNFLIASSTCLATSALENPSSCTNSSFEFALNSVCRVFHAVSALVPARSLQNASSCSLSPAELSSDWARSMMPCSVTTFRR